MGRPRHRPRDRRRGRLGGRQVLARRRLLLTPQRANSRIKYANQLFHEKAEGYQGAVGQVGNAIRNSSEPAGSVQDPDDGKPLNGGSGMPGKMRIAVLSAAFSLTFLALAPAAHASAPPAPGPGVSRACAPGTQPSGPSWVSKYPATDAVSALAPGFRRDVRAFVAALKPAKIAARAVSTLRPPQRAYLMHWSWLVSKGKVKPENVPAFTPAGHESPVGICWIHLRSSGIDKAASVRAATQMVAAYGIDPRLTVAPALYSRHTQGLAIDMTTNWAAKKVRIRAGNGRLITIKSTPRSELNPLLIKVARTYGVVHFVYPAQDPNHWSSDGH